MAREPKPIVIERILHGWIAEPPKNPITGNVKPDDMERARAELERKIADAGQKPDDFTFSWRMVDVSWGWVARLR